MFDSATMIVAGDAIAARITHLSLHSAGDVTSSANETTAARQPVTWTVDGNGDMSVADITWTGGTPAGLIVRVGYQTALTGGTYCGGQIALDDSYFDGAGAFTVDVIHEYGTST